MTKGRGQRWRAIQDSVPMSETLADLSDHSERLFWRLISQSDTWGRLPGSIRKVRGKCIPLLGWDDSKLKEALDELEETGRILTYTIEREQFIQIVDFEINQPAELTRKRGNSRFPEPPGYSESTPAPLPESSGEGRTGTEHSAQRPPREEKKREEKNTPSGDSVANERDIAHALTELFGCDPAPNTSAGRTRKAAIRDLVAHGATLDSISTVAAAYRTTYRNARLTDTALAKHYPTLNAPATNGSEHEDPALRRRRFTETNGWLLEPEHLEHELASLGADPEEVTTLLAVAEARRAGAPETLRARETAA